MSQVYLFTHVLPVHIYGVILQILFGFLVLYQCYSINLLYTQNYAIV